jgi:hypothetical protein
LRAQLESTGQMIGNSDLWIAAYARGRSVDSGDQPRARVSPDHGRKDGKLGRVGEQRQIDFQRTTPAIGDEAEA